MNDKEESLEQSKFPENFIWGVATSAYQIEGAVDVDGRKPSVWDTFCNRSGVRTGESGLVANDHYHCYADDIRLMAELGIKHYRFSIAWPRIIPDGRGTVNEKGVDFYRRLLDCMGHYGITPYVTLYHWDTPQALEDRYGSWRSREIAGDFATYAGEVVRRLGDRVDRWFTLNEIPCFTCISWTAGTRYQGMTAPGLSVSCQKDVNQTVWHALLAHGKGVQAIRAASPRPCRIALVDNLGIPVPLTGSAADVEASRRAFQLAHHNAEILYPLISGKHGEIWAQRASLAGEMPDIQPGDMELVSQPLDLLGLNVYSGDYVRSAENKDGFEKVPVQTAHPLMDLDWFKLIPETAYWSLRHVRDVLGYRGDIMITENGCPCPDELTPSGEVLDTTRIMMLRSYLGEFQKAIREGIPLVGYFVWSFLDNFEWTYGYSKRCGIVWNGFETQTRIPKASARWYAQCIAENRIV